MFYELVNIMICPIYNRVCYCLCTHLAMFHKAPLIIIIICQDDFIIVFFCDNFLHAPLTAFDTLYPSDTSCDVPMISHRLF